MVRRSLIEGLTIVVDDRRVILEDDLIIIVRTLDIAIDAVGNHQFLWRISGSAENRAVGRAIDAAAAVVVCLAADRVNGLVVIGNLAQPDSGHDAVGFGIHFHTVDFIDVKGDKVEVVLFGGVPASAVNDAPADSVVLKFEGAADAAAVGVKSDAAEVAGKIFDRSDDVVLKIGFDKQVVKE